jgi:hypothetical protein
LSEDPKAIEVFEKWRGVEGRCAETPDIIEKCPTNEG